MTDSTYAVYGDDGVIINTVVWDGETEWLPPDGTKVVACGDQLCQIGGSYLNGKFSPAPQPAIDLEQLIQQATIDKSGLMDLASQKVSVLQDAVDLDMATDDEKQQLLEWKKYRVLLNRVDTSQAPNITWPSQPS